MGLQRKGGRELGQSVKWLSTQLWGVCAGSTSSHPSWLPRPEETSCAPSPSKTGAWGPETDVHCLRQWEGVGGEARGQPTGRVHAKPMGMHPSLIQPWNLLEQPWGLFPKLQSFLDPLRDCCQI